MSRIAFIVCPAAAVVLAAPAMAASSDYLLVIDGTGKEDSVSAKVSNWSFGATQPQPAPPKSGRGAKPNLGSSGQDGVVSPRDPSSGMASGRKSGEIQAADFKVAGDLDGDGRLDFAEAEKLDQVGPLTVTVPSGSPAAKVLCASTHLRSGHIEGPDGTTYDLGTIKAVCAGDDGSSVTVAMTGSMKHKNYTGHVTLMK